MSESRDTEELQKDVMYWFVKRRLVLTRCGKEGGNCRERAVVGRSGRRVGGRGKGRRCGGLGRSGCQGNGQDSRQKPEEAED